MSSLRPSRVPGFVRWLHTYLSLAGFTAILFFAVTGLTLNHAAWFESGGEREREVELAVPRTLLEDPQTVALAQWLRATAGVRGDVHDVSIEDESISIVLKGPGYAADAWIDVAAGTANVRERELNAWAVLDDLHKGRDSGATWSWLIDASAILMALSALTGLWLVLYVKRRRNPGLVVTLVGTLVVLAVGWLWTP